VEIAMITPPQQYAWRGFDQLSTTELYLLLRLRCEVFVVEQRCAYLDIDGRDQEADHLLAWGANDRLSGYLRVFAPGKADASAQIGRVVTSSEGRGAGLGRWMVKEALGFIAKRQGDVQVKISAQVYLERFYADFGFRRSSDDYSEDGILHCEMLRA
jgi:ElaA protein